MQALKWVGILLGLLVILIVAAMIIIPMVINPNDFRDEIADAVHDSTGRNLTINGDIALSVWPSLSLDLGEVTLSNAEGFGDQSFAHIDSASVSVALMPLLDKQVEADKVSLRGLALNLQVDKDGNNNWDDLTAASAKKDDKDSGDQNLSVAALAIGGIEISDARLSWDDRQNNQKLEMSDLDLTTGAIELREPIDIDLSFKVTGAEPKINADVALSSTVEINLLSKRYRARETKLVLKMDSSTFGVNSSVINLGADIIADLSQKVISLGDIKLESTVELSDPGLVASMSVVGGAMYRMNNQTLRTEGTVIEFDAKGDAVGGHTFGTLVSDIAVDMFNQRYDLTNFDLQATAEGKAFPDGKAEVKLKSNIAVDLTQDSATLRELVVDALGVYLTGEVLVSDLQKNALAKGNLDIAEFDLRKLMAQLGQPAPVTSDPQVLRKLALKTTFAGSQDKIALSDIVLTLDDTRINGNMAVTNFSKPGVDFKLNVDSIDVDRYMPPASSAPTQSQPVETGVSESTSKPSKAVTKKAAPVGIPLDVIRELNINGVLDIGHLKINNLNTDKVHLNLKAKNGVLDVNPFKANLYQGNATLKVHVDASKPTATYRIEKKVSNVQIGPLLKDLNGEDKLQGMANISSNITTRGNDVDAVKRGLNGKVNLDVADGALKGVNIRKMIKDAKATLKGQATTSATTTEDKTEFSSMHISGVLKNGVFSSNDLDARSPLLRISGDGQVNIAANSINYLVKAKIVGTSKGQGGSDLDQLSGLTIPVRISGDLAEPGYKVDLGKVLEDEAKRKLKEKAKQKLQDKLGSKLGGLLGGTTSSPDTATPDAQPPKEDLKEQLKNKLFKSFF